ncbi:hypothetical protein N9X63_01665 [Woeseiaceae bacterium]|jgi:leucyl aminopeptidase|nr:hypothetical protein [Woeseiaceae bacterium]
MAELHYNDFQKNIRIIQQTGTPKNIDLENINQILLILPKKISNNIWKNIPQGENLKALIMNRSSGGLPTISTRLKNKKQTALHIGKFDPKKEAHESLTSARKMIQATSNEKSGIIAIWILGFDENDQESIARAMISAALAAKFMMPEYKSNPSKEKINSIKLIGMNKKINLEREIAESHGNNIARWLTALPANKLDALNYIDLLSKLSNDLNWELTVHKTEELKTMGAGAFLAVSQGNEDDSAAIVRIKFKPHNKEAKKTLSLVGKGIIFDTGGSNLKPFNSMLDMHIDMGGSAVALGTLLAITKLNLPIEVDCWLAITENRTGPKAYKSQDVITAANGKTIQTIHTDAEGRMVLADALFFAAKEKPDFIIDYATLTGACMNAVTTRYSGAFTNHPDLHQAIKKSGTESGERVWPFPIGKEFMSELASETADIKQCSPGGGGDHILAACFLNEFVDPLIPWIHIDLSAATNKGGLAHIPTKITGFGVRFSLNLIIERDILNTKS